MMERSVFGLFRISNAMMYQFCAGAIDMGEGVAARSNKALPEAHTTSNHCANQNNVPGIEKCILDLAIDPQSEIEFPKGWEAPWVVRKD